MAGNAVFLDSNGWIALLNTRETLHFDAAERWRGLSRAASPVILTDWIVAETGNGLARTAVRSRFAEIVQEMLRNRRFRVVEITPELLERALLMYSDRPDKTWGLVDCASFVVMADEGITEAFTTDKHFEQAGFERLLPAEPT
jgi:predicted nucleic acid-binding protein